MEASLLIGARIAPHFGLPVAESKCTCLSGLGIRCVRFDAALTGAPEALCLNYDQTIQPATTVAQSRSSL